MNTETKSPRLGASEVPSSASSRTCDCLILLLSLIVTLLLAHAPTAGAACTEVPSHVDFQGLQVSPSVPRVGDMVDVHFDVDIAVYSVTALQLEGTDTLLDGETVLHSTRDATFQLTAVQAGTASIALAVTYGTEEACTDSYGYTYYQPGPEHTVTSAPYDLHIAEAAPACPGDCDASGAVSIDELVNIVNVIFGDASREGCSGVDADDDGSVTISDLIAAIAAALTGCGPDATFGGPASS